MQEITNLSFQSSAIIPTDSGDFELRAYSNDVGDSMPHLAIINPDTDFDKPVLLRIHSECITGDLFGSNRCECGEQLQKSLAMAAENGGVVIYLRQEGRGIGLINKLKAYRKQDQGMDTVEANLAIGHEVDGRNYENAIAIIRDLGIRRINLLTNNPDKIQAIRESEIELVGVVPLIIPAKKENEKYLKTKKEVMGHLLNNERV